MNSNNYNCLVKLAAGGVSAAVAAGVKHVLPTVAQPMTPLRYTGPTNMSPGTSMQAPNPKPQVYPAINPATGGYRVSYKSGRPIGPVADDHSIRRDPLPIVPYSSGKIVPNSIQQARRQASLIGLNRTYNDIGKERNAQNLDAMFKSLHEANQQRRAAGLPDYQPQALDLYAPHASSRADYADAENRIYNDIHLSTIAQEAARRGTPLNDAEINEVSSWMPQSGQSRTERSTLPQPYYNNMGLKVPADLSGTSPQQMGERANGLWQ